MTRKGTSRVEKRRAAREYTCAFQRATEIDKSETDAIVARILYNLRRIVALNEAAARLNSGDATQQGEQVGQQEGVAINNQSGDINDQDEDATNYQASQTQHSREEGTVEAVGDTTQQDGGDDEHQVRDMENL